MKEFSHNLKLAWNYVKKHKGKLLLYLLCNVVHIFISVVAPIISAQIIVKLTNNLLVQVLQMAFVLLCTEILRNMITYFSGFLSQKIYRESFIDIQTDLGREILKLENSCIDQNSSGVFIQRLTNGSMCRSLRK